MKPLLKKLVYPLLFIFVLVLSEFIYIVNVHRQNLISTYAVYSAQGASKRHDIPKTVSSLSWAAQLNIKALPEKYSSLIPQDYQIKLVLPNANDNFENSVANYIESLDLERIARTEEGDLARVFYNLAIISAKEGEDNLDQSFFQTAVFLNPELSHFHVALANYYLLKGNTEKAQEAISFCLKFKNPQRHCKDYRDGSFAQKAPEEIDFLEKELNKYYQSK